MDHEKIVDWLIDHAGAVIRYRVAMEYPEVQRKVNLGSLQKELIDDKTVNQWLNNLNPFESLLEARLQGKGLGASGNSSFLHGSTDMNFEVVVPKLAQLGLHAGIPVLDTKIVSWLNLLESKWKQKNEYIDPPDNQFLSAVYYYYDYLLIIASSLSLAGYIQHDVVKQVLLFRLNSIFEIIKDGRFDFYEQPGKYRIHPKEWSDHILKLEIFADGNIKLPFIHDVFGFIDLWKHGNQETKDKIGTIIHWILTPEYQHFLYNYGYIRCPDGRGKSVGYKLEFPGYFNHVEGSFNSRSIVLRCWQMAHFPESRDHPWFRKSIQYLEKYKTQNGTYIFPKDFLTETKARGYWIHGWRMGLGENRRSTHWLEIESTFWMFLIHMAMEPN